MHDARESTIQINQTIENKIKNQPVNNNGPTSPIIKTSKKINNTNRN